MRDNERWVLTRLAKDICAKVRKAKAARTVFLTPAEYQSDRWIEKLCDPQGTRFDAYSTRDDLVLVGTYDERATVEFVLQDIEDALDRQGVEA